MQRREVLTYGALGAALATFGDDAWAMRPARQKKSILILGGTGFVGPATIEVALARGHQVTMFNRGKTRPDLFPSVERLVGDRDPKVGEGLKSLEGRKFDVVIDNSGYRPRHVKASADLLAKNGAAHYIFISSISCYREPVPVRGDEDSPLAVLKDPAVEEMGANYENYGGLKVLCEQAASQAFPNGAIIVRPGYIVGPDDPTGRFTYWPVRFAKGGTVAVPGTRKDPFQIIDVRDLGAWLVKLAEDGATGRYNAVGPRQPAAWGDVVNHLRHLAPKGTKIQWVPPEFLSEHPGLPAPVEFPIWAPAVGDTAGFHTWKNDRAWRAGLRFRPISQTVRDTLAWYREQEKVEKGRTKLAGPSEQDEAKLIEAYAASTAKPKPADKPAAAKP